MFKIGDSSVWAYDYDEGGNRISKRVALLPISGTDTSWTPVRKYVYDSVNMVVNSGQLDSNWNQYAFLVYKRLAWVSQDSGLRVRYIGSDHLGTANLLMDSAGGILSRYVLDPWGNVEYAKETVPLRYLYTGKESDAEAGGMVTYINARYLDNERGMWLGRDPAEEFYTPYGYVGNGANETIDPDGQQTPSFGANFQSAFSFGFGRDFGVSPSQSVLNINSSIDENISSLLVTTDLVLEYTGNFSDGLAFGSSVCGGLSLAIPGAQPAAPFFFSGSLVFSRVSLVTDFASLGIHTIQASRGEGSTETVAGDVGNIIVSSVAEKVGVKLIGKTSHMAQDEARTLRQIGNTGGGFLGGRVWDSLGGGNSSIKGSFAPSDATRVDLFRKLGR